MKKFPGEYVKGPRGRLLLTPEQQDWLRREYPVNKTGDLAAAMGVCYPTVTNWAKELGLEKKPSFIKKIHRASMAKAQEVLRQTGFYEQFKQPGAMDKVWAARDAHYASGGDCFSNMTPRQKRAFIRARSKKMATLLHRDKMRQELGLSPLTKRKYVSRRFTRQEVGVRYTAANKYGYLLDDPTPKSGKERYTIYYDSDTHRNTTFEANSIKVGFTFLPA